MRVLKVALILCTLGILTACSINIQAPEAPLGAGSASAIDSGQEINDDTTSSGSDEEGSGWSGVEDSIPLPSEGAAEAAEFQAGLGSFFLNETEVEAVGDRRIYRNSSKFRDLETAGYMEPGASYLTWKNTADRWGQCSFGWWVGNDTKIYNLTAGHCGEVGDKVYVDTSGGEQVHIGEFVYSAYDEGALVSGPDYGLIEIHPDYFSYVVTNPRVSMSDSPVRLQGVARTEWLESAKPYMCRLGFRSGLSCGSYEEMVNHYTVKFANITDHGDSGGAIWAFDPRDSTQTEIWAVAVNSYGSDYDATFAAGKVIEPVMDEFDLKIFN
ncbi:hypothetical protein ACG98H_05915 [Corynebacterium sp. L4756]|uniref:hypothetical protein n=1 Tax=unclassified Corynebacterium TaxID=2624378 RepID=UPI00374D1BA1